MLITGCLFYILVAFCHVVEQSAQEDGGSFWEAKIKKTSFILDDCTGVLIETNVSGYSDTVVSAPGCFPLTRVQGEYRHESTLKPDDFSVIFIEYSSDGNATGREIVHKVARIIIHPNFEHETREYDIAVLKLDKQVSEIRPLVVSTYNLSDVENCSLLALSVINYSTAHVHFIQLSLLGLKIGEESRNIEWQVSDEIPGEDIYARYASPLMCSRKGQFYVQGFVQDLDINRPSMYGIELFNDSTLYIVDAVSKYDWIMNPTVIPNPPIVFHAELAKVEDEHQGSIVSRTAEYAWRVNRLSEKISVAQKNRSYEVKRDFERVYVIKVRNSYDCAIQCFRRNQGNPCAYVKETHECYELQNCIITQRDIIPNPAILIQFPETTMQCPVGSHRDESCPGDHLCLDVVQNITGERRNTYPKYGCSCDDGYARDVEYNRCIKEEQCRQNVIDYLGYDTWEYLHGYFYESGPPYNEGAFVYEQIATKMILKVVSKDISQEGLEPPTDDYEEGCVVEVTPKDLGIVDGVKQMSVHGIAEEIRTSCRAVQYILVSSLRLRRLSAECV